MTDNQHIIARIKSNMRLLNYNAAQINADLGSFNNNLEAADYIFENGTDFFSAGFSRANLSQLATKCNGLELAKAIHQHLPQLLERGYNEETIIMLSRNRSGNSLLVVRNEPIPSASKKEKPIVAKEPKTATGRARHVDAPETLKVLDRILAKLPDNELSKSYKPWLRKECLRGKYSLNVMHAIAKNIDKLLEIPALRNEPAIIIDSFVNASVVNHVAKNRKRITEVQQAAINEVVGEHTVFEAIATHRTAQFEKLLAKPDLPKWMYEAKQTARQDPELAATANQALPKQMEI